MKIDVDEGGIEGMVQYPPCRVGCWQQFCHQSYPVVLMVLLAGVPLAVHRHNVETSMACRDQVSAVGLCEGYQGGTSSYLRLTLGIAAFSDTICLSAPHILNQSIHIVKLQRECSSTFPIAISFPAPISISYISPGPFPQMLATLSLVVLCSTRL